MKTHFIAAAIILLLAFLVGVFAFAAYHGAYHGAYNAFDDFVDYKEP